MKKAIFILSVIQLFFACGTSRKTTTLPQTTNYKHDSNIMRPQFVIFHVSDSISELHFKISSKEVLYMRPDGINFLSNVLISYRLQPNYQSQEIIDSSSNLISVLLKDFGTGKLLLVGSAGVATGTAATGTVLTEEEERMGGSWKGE